MKHFTSTLCLCLIACTIFFGPTFAQTTLGSKDAAQLPATDLERVVAGKEAPDFTLEDQAGKPITLSEYRGKKSVVLVFYRGYWWLYCVDQLGKLKSLLNEELRNQAEVLAVSVDPHDKTLAIREKLKANPGPEFPLLSDADHRVIDRYGLFNDKARRPIPHPATYVIDRKGVVRWRFVEVDYKIRPSNEDVLKELLKIERSGANKN
jgi:peroxiredoxin